MNRSELFPRSWRRGQRRSTLGLVVVTAISLAALVNIFMLHSFTSSLKGITQDHFKSGNDIPLFGRDMDERSSVDVIALVGRFGNSTDAKMSITKPPSMMWSGTTKDICVKRTIFTPLPPKFGSKQIIAILVATRSFEDWTDFQDTTLRRILIPSLTNTITKDEREKFRYGST